MPVTLTATLLAATDPRPVQVVLNGTTAGDAYEVTGSSSDGSRWAVPGGKGVSEGSQVLLIDTRSALNTPITYTAVVAGVTYTATPVTVVGPEAVIQTIDGLTVVEVIVHSFEEARTNGIRSGMFEVAGRPDPAVRLEVPGSSVYSWVLGTDGVESRTLRAILQSGLPIVRRMTPGFRDADPVVVGVVLGWEDSLDSGIGAHRLWSLRVREIADPQPSTPLIAFTWDDFDAAMADRVWSYHSTLASVTGLTATNGTLSVQASGGYPDGAGTSFGRLTVTTAATAASVFETAFTAAATTLGTPVVAGMVVTVTMRVKGTAGRTLNAAIKWSGGTISAGTTKVATGTWQQVSVTATAPAGTTGLAYGVQLAATGVLSSDVVDFDSVTISQGVMVPVGTFDELFTTWDDFDKADWTQL